MNSSSPNRSTVRIEPMRVVEDFQTCIDFRRLSYITSFGTEVGFAEEMGPDNQLYRKRLERNLSQIPNGNVHLWRADAIVGQLEMKLPEGQPHVAYVSLFFVAPDERRHGLGSMLHAHALDTAANAGKAELQLSVSASNVVAQKFYEKHLWNNLGPRPGKESVRLMQRIIFAGSKGSDP